MFLTQISAFWDPITKSDYQKYSDGRLQDEWKNIVNSDELLISLFNGRTTSTLSKTRILQTIMKMSKIEAFLVKPNPDLYGMSSYYSIIKQPMWLNEVHRKLMDREYSGINEVVADIKLLLENCYRFWGPSHRVTKRGLNIEHKLEQKLAELPPSLKNKWLSLEESRLIIYKTEKGDDIENADDVVDENSKETAVNNMETDYSSYATYKGFHSKILNKVLSSEQNEHSSDDTFEDQKKKEEEMLAWENEFLVNEKMRNQIKHSSQLAEIGQFLKITSAVLNVEEMTQYEIERMLLMPQESTSLATLMTSMLSPAGLRSSLDVTPIMPYQVWTAKLKKKVQYWLNMYYKTDAIQVCNIFGIDPYFWEVMALVNPLDEKRFHEIPFYERVWILKSLCDNLLSTNKSVQDVFLDETRESELRPTEFGIGPGGYIYFGLEFFPEIRIYRHKKVLKKTWKGWDKAEVGIFKLLRSTLLPSWDENDGRIYFIPNEKYFSMEADSVDSLVNLIQNLDTKGFNELKNNLQVYLNKAKKHKHRLEGLEAIYTQWHEYQKRPPEYFTNLLNLWLSTECPVFNNKNDGCEEEYLVLGKRRSTKTNVFSAPEYMESLSESSDDIIDEVVSDWEEETASKRKKKNLKKKRKTSKCSINDSATSNNDNDSNREGGNIIQSVKENSISETSVNKNRKEVKERINAVPFIEVKKEKEDVIMISSDEEDIKPSLPILPSSAASLPPSVTLLPVVQQPPPIKTPPVVSAPPVPASVAKLGSSITLFKITPTKSTNESPTMSVVEVRPKPNLIRPSLPQITMEPIRMPQPIIEEAVVMPKPIPEIVKTPRKRPVPRPIQEPPPPVTPTRNHNTSPRQNWNQGTPSPRSRNHMQTTPPSPRVMPTPITGNNMMRPVTSNQRGNPGSMVQRNLFPPAPTANSPPTIEGVLHIGQKDDGSYGYQIRLLDGGLIKNVSREDIESLRRQYNGNLPNVVKVPLNRHNNRMLF